MAIALDGAATRGISFTGTLTVSKTCTGSDRILFVSCFGDTTDKITGATYNSVAMTLIDKVVSQSERWLYLFYLIAPDTGAHDAVISSSGADAIEGHVISYTGARQSSQPDAQNSNFTTASPDAIAVTVVADNSWMIGTWRAGVTDANADAGTQERQAANGLYTADSNGPLAAGSHSLSYSRSGATFAAIAASFAPAVAATGRGALLPLLGVS